MRLSVIGFGVQDGFELGDKGWEALLDGLPYSSYINTPIGVYHDVSHVLHLSPWDRCESLSNFIWYVAGGLADDNKFLSTASIVLLSALKCSMSIPWV